MAERTPTQKKAQLKYLSKLHEIRVRIPEEYYSTVKSYAESKEKSVNKLIIELLEKEMGQQIPTLREQKKSAESNE